MNKYLIICMVAMSFTACDDFLDTPPKIVVSTDKYWKTVDDAERAIIAVYGPLTNEYYFGHTESIYDCQSDDLYRAGDWGIDTKLENFNSSADDGDNFGAPWNLKFEGVKRANDVIKNVPGMDIPDQKKNEILGQAYFMRAFHYSRLMLPHGGLPLIDEKLPITEYNQPRSTLAETYEFITNDLEKAAELLPISWPSVDLGKPNKGAAWGLLCRFYLYQEKYTDALRVANEVLKYPSDYHLLSNYRDNFVVEKATDPEVMFAAKLMSMADSPAWAPKLYYYPHGLGGWNFFHPTQSIVDEFECLDGSPVRKIKFNKTESGSFTFNYTDNNEVVDWNVEFARRDPRLRATVVVCGESFNMNGEIYSFEVGNATTGYCCFKYIDEKNHAGFANLHYCIIRVSDVYLMKAEALLKTGGSATEIDDLVYKVRQRVGLPRINGCTMDDIIHERRCEFATEGLRHYDLMRWKMAKSVYSKDTGPDGPRTFVEGKNEFLPIPQAEIDLSQGVLVQNPGY